MIRWIVAFCMQVWIEDRAKRRAKKDAALMNDLRRAVSANEEVPQYWKQIPQRLRVKCRTFVLEWLEQQAEIGSGDMPAYIIRAQECDVWLSEKDRLRLLEVAFRNAHHMQRKLKLAKAMHGNPLPLFVVWQLTAELRESVGWWFTTDNEDLITLLLPEIDTKNEEQVHAFLRIFAEKGRCLLLTAACKMLERPVPEDLLLQAMDANMERKEPTYFALRDLCIRRKDWERGEKLIAMLREGNQQERTMAGQIALAMYEDRQGVCADA